VLQPAPVLDLVLADDGNPRGLAFQFAAIGHLLDQISEDGDRSLAATATALLTDIQTAVTRVAEAPDQAVAACALPESLHKLAASVATLSDRVTRHYFALLPTAQTLGMGEESLSFRGAA
jgi:uncharacterized alpha-E superfamily protein